MAYPYPPRHPDLPYIGKHHYFLTFTTTERARLLEAAEPVNLVRAQIVRASREQRFAIVAYCFMPDHLHLVINGEDDGSNCRAFIRAAKQFSGYYYKQRYGHRLWQRYGFDRVIRDDAERALAIGYVAANPVRAGLAGHPSEYPHLGSDCYTVAEMLEVCDYHRR